MPPEVLREPRRRADHTAQPCDSGVQRPMDRSGSAADFLTAIELPRRLLPCGTWLDVLEQHLVVRLQPANRAPVTIWMVTSGAGRSSTAAQAPGTNVLRRRDEAVAEEAHSR